MSNCYNYGSDGAHSYWAAGSTGYTGSHDAAGRIAATPDSSDVDIWQNGGVSAPDGTFFEMHRGTVYGTTGGSGRAGNTAATGASVSGAFTMPNGGTIGSATVGTGGSGNSTDETVRAP
ncbi:MAG: hypothetical protein LBS82_01715 [Spirochaetaceae bacterium]|nr:hypothetical protein [Spirochaetaceae bacterium]